MQDEQFASFSPPELIKLAFFCALLEQTPHSPDKELVSRRYELIRSFLEGITRVAPIESYFSAIAYSKEVECAALCKRLGAAFGDSKIPPSLSMWRSSVLYKLRKELQSDKDDPFMIEARDLIELVFVSLVKFGNVLNVWAAEYLFKVLYTVALQVAEGDNQLDSDGLFIIKSASKNLPVFFSNDLFGHLCDISVAGFPSAEISSVNLHYLFSKCSEFLPLKILEEGRKKLTQSQTHALSSVQENEAQFDTVTSIIVAFMREHVRVSLADNVVSLWKLSKLYVQLLPPFVKFSVHFIKLIRDEDQVHDDRLYVEDLKGWDQLTDCLQKNLYKNSTFAVDSYVSRLQFLATGVGNAFCLSEQCKEYFLEAQLMHNCQQLTITTSTSTETIVSKWDKLFKRTALFSIAKSFRPLIARWIRWSLMIHNLRHELAKFTAVGVVGLVNSGKSQLVNKLFQIKVCGSSCNSGAVEFTPITNSPWNFP